MQLTTIGQRLIHILIGGRLRRLFAFFWLSLGASLGAIFFFITYVYYPVAPIPLENKRTLEMGWQTPKLQEMPQYIEVAQTLPFDGIIFDIDVPGPARGLSWKLFGDEPVDQTLLDGIVVDLEGMEWGKLTDNFIRVNIAPGNVDWFDDFDTLLNNLEEIARLAYQLDFQGIMLDTEQYRSSNYRLFDYQTLPYSERYDFDEYSEQVYQRGQEIMQALNRGYPGITVLYTFGISLVSQIGAPDDLSNHPEGLLKPFIEGMIAAADEETTLVDAIEGSYGYTSEQQFLVAYKLIKGLTHDLVVRDPERYGEVMQAGFGLWIDHDCGEGPLQPGGCPNGFTPESFQRALALAQYYSERYVWVYSERVSWYTGEGIPVEWHTALDLHF